MWLYDGPEAGPMLILAHGSGAPMDAPFLADLARGLGRVGFRVVRFEFPYMAKRRQDGKPRPPDRREVLVESWRGVLAQCGRPAADIIMAGKSLGSRIASYLVDEVGAGGLVAFGYPYHPPGRPENLRTDHLATLRTPALFLQGQRDPFGTEAEVALYELAPTIERVTLPDGDHGFAPRKRSGYTLEGNLELAVAHCLAFARRVLPQAWSAGG